MRNSIGCTGSDARRPDEGLDPATIPSNTRRAGSPTQEPIVPAPPPPVPSPSCCSSWTAGATARRSRTTRWRRPDLPNWHRCWATCPHTLLHTEGRHVGLPDGQMGNSEVGHMNLGAGRIVYQDLTRIDAAIEDGSFCRQRATCARLSPRRQRNGRHPAPDGPAVRRRRAQPRGPPAVAWLELARAQGVPRSRSTPSSTAATPPPRRPAASLERLPAVLRHRRRQCAHRHASAAATTRWTATSAGSACAARDVMVDGAGEHVAADALSRR